MATLLSGSTFRTKAVRCKGSSLSVREFHLKGRRGNAKGEGWQKGILYEGKQIQIQLDDAKGDVVSKYRKANFVDTLLQLKQSILNCHVCHLLQSKKAPSPRGSSAECAVPQPAKTGELKISLVGDGLLQVIERLLTLIETMESYDVEQAEEWR